MNEFKGTKGDLELKYVSGVCIGIGTIGDYCQITANTILPETDEDYEIEKEEIISNMKLYAAAPDLLKSIQEIIQITDRDHVVWNRAKKAIEKALK